MAGASSVDLFLVARYTVFALFIICNAITCSVAVWNYSLVDDTQLVQIDVYLISIGAISLVSIFTLVFTELLCVDSLTARVWFECAWVALFWIMELAGAAALIAIESDIPCSGKASIFPDALCASQRVLLAFAWMCAVILLMYLFALVFVAASLGCGDSKIWVSDVRALRAVAVRQRLNAPNSPLTTRFKKRPSVKSHIQRPAHIQPVQTFHHSLGLDLDYEIEPFHPVSMVAPEQMDVHCSSDLPEAIRLPLIAVDPIKPSLLKPLPSLSRGKRNVVALSPNHLDPPRELKSSIAYANSGLPSRPTSSQGASLPLAAPLDDWPRRDIMQRPVEPKARRRSPPPSTFEFPKKHARAMAASERILVHASHPRPRRPSGPRQRVPSVEGVHRPAPLDLTGISNFERRDDVV